jgi:hypothetical protein
MYREMPVYALIVTNTLTNMENKYHFDEKNHAHFLGNKPLIGTSTAVGIISKPLTYWASGMAVGTLGWTATKADPDMRLEVATIALDAIKGLDGTGWLKRLDLAYKAHASNLKKTATAGTDLHAELERYVKNTMANVMATYDDKIMPFITWANENVKEFTFSEGYCYSKELWVGGICDAGAKMKDGKFALFDFKSAKDAYYTHYVQVGGYSLQIHENGVFDKDGKEIDAFNVKADVLYIVPFGAEDTTPRPQYDVDGYQNAFRACVQLYKSSEGFNDNK